MYNYRAKVIRVIDAETFEVMVDLGFKTYRREKIRLMGIDAYEKKTVKGQLATKWVEDILDGDIELRVFKQGKYGRYLAVVYYFDVGEKKNLNKELVEMGYAKEYNGGKR